MKRLHQFLQLAVALMLALWCRPAAGQAVTSGKYQLVTQRRVTLTDFEYTYRVTLVNHGLAIQHATGHVSSASVTTRIVDGDVAFGAVPAGGSGVSTDTFTIRQDRRVRFNASDLTWQFSVELAPVSVPTLVGLSEAAATAAILNQNLQLGTISRVNDDATPAGIVTRQTPGAGGKVAPGSSVDLTISLGPVANNPPTVNAGPDQVITLPDSALLSGQASDDGRPAGGGLTTTWSKVSGPGGVTFGNVHLLSTTASFDRPGEYVLQLTASDSALSASDSLTVLVNSANVAPTVDAGADQIVTLPDAATLSGSVSDDGLPAGSHVTVNWSKVSGPGTVAFTDATAAATGATFDASGVYVLRLTASDSALNASDDVTITVQPAPAPTLLSVDPNAGTLGQTLQVTIHGQSTHFVTGQTQASFGSDIAVGTGAAGQFGPVTVIDKVTAFAMLAISGQAATGPRNIVVRTGTEQPVLTNGFNVQSSGLPTTIELRLDRSVLPPDGVATATIVARDATGAPIANTNLSYVLTVAAIGPVSGNAPVVQGLTIRFPKVVKRLLSQDPSQDPDGAFADGDPTDPNYGTETGGFYRVTATLQGTPLTDTAPVTVIPSPTAGLTLEVDRYAGSLSSVFNAVIAADQADDTAALYQARVNLESVMAEPNFRFEVLNINQVLAPPNGNLVTPAMLQQAGFIPSPSDGQFATVLSALTAKVSQITARLNQVNVANLTAADIADLQQLANDYRALDEQLAVVSPSALGVTQQGGAINVLITEQLPKLLDALRTRGYGVLIGVPAANALPAGSFRVAQFGTFFSTFFSVLTDLAGTARGNIIELAVSLVNDLINIEAAHIINAQALPGVALNYVQGSASLSFVCPNYSPSTIGVQGFGRDASKIRVAIIGCLDSQLIRNLATLKPFKDLAGAIRLMFKIQSIAGALQRDQSVAALVTPDFVDDDFIFDGDLLYFNAGWPRVNQGRLPCVGLFVVMNVATGAFGAINADLLATCG